MWVVTLLSCIYVLSRYDACILWLDVKKEILNERLDKRIDTMMEVCYSCFCYCVAFLLIVNVVQKGLVPELHALSEKVGSFMDSTHGILQAIGM